jgi:hypothetical protein
MCAFPKRRIKRQRQAVCSEQRYDYEHGIETAGKWLYLYSPTARQVRTVWPVSLVDLPALILSLYNSHAPF